MAQKKLKKIAESSSSPTSPAKPTPTVNPALKVTDSVDDVVETKAAKSHATRGKPKRKAEKTPSPPKKQKVCLPLLTGPLDPNVHVSDRLQFNLTPEERKPFKDMTPSESINMAYELIARASICLNYSAGTTKPLLVNELEMAMSELADFKKKNIALTLRVEELTKAAEDDRVKATEQLKESQKEVASLKASLDTLNNSVLELTSKIKNFTKERDDLIIERGNLAAETARLGDQVCLERELGFEQGIAQCHHFFKTPLTDPNFDIMKVVVDGKLIDLGSQVATNTENTETVVDDQVPTVVDLASKTTDPADKS